MILGSVASAGLAILTATRIAAGEVTGFFRLGAIGVERLQHRLVARAARRRTSRRTVGRHGDAARAHHRVGRSRCRSSRRCSRPPPASTLAAHTTTIWRTQVRFIGAGAIAVAAIYTLARLAKPVVGGLVSTLAASQRARTQRRPRSRPLAAVDLRAHGRVPRHRRRGSRSRSRGRRVLAPSAVDADAHRGAVRAARRLPHRRHLRLHGGTHRRVEQPDLRRRHPLDRALRVDPRRRRAADADEPDARSSRSRCSSRRSCSRARRSRTTTCRI